MQAKPIQNNYKTCEDMPLVLNSEELFTAVSLLRKVLLGDKSV